MQPLNDFASPPGGAEPSVEASCTHDVSLAG